jgi:hypothetical protein
MSVVTCVDCGKPLEKIPSWLAGVKVKFTCEECRTKHRASLVIPVDDLPPLPDETNEDMDVIEREEGLETTSLEELAQEEERGAEEEEEEV